MTKKKNVELINQAQAGSEDSLGELLEFYRPYMLRVAEETIASWLRPKLSASDVVQGTIVLAYDRFSQFEGATSSDFRAWLIAIFRNHLTDGIRRYRYAAKRAVGRETAEVSPFLVGESDGPDAQVAAQESVARLLEIISELPSDHRRIVRLRYIQALSFAAIAKELNCTPDMARRKWLSAIDELTKRLRP